jgi:hypothetical protein
VYEATSRGFGPDKFFFCYALVPLLIFLAQVTLLPAHSYHTVPQLEVKMEETQDATRDIHESDDEIESRVKLQRVRRKREGRRQDKICRLNELLGDGDERQHKFD